MEDRGVVWGLGEERMAEVEQSVEEEEEAEDSDRSRGKVAHS